MKRFWTSERREAVRGVLGRLGFSLLWLVLSAFVLVILILSTVSFFEPREPSNAWKWWLVLVAFLFACSVAPLVVDAPPRWLRVVGIVYALAGAWLLIALWRA